MSRKPKIPTTLEQVLIEAIRKSGLTQTELSARSGVPQAAISRFLIEDPAQRRTITLPAASRLCEVLGLKVIRARKRRRD